MSIPNAVQTSRRPTLRITWQRTNGEPVDLTGSAITGTIKNKSTGATAAITGTLALVDADMGIFSWAFGSVDVGTAGNFFVQFRATYGDATFELSIPESWEVVTAL